MTKIYNFSAGPSVLPKTVLQRAAAEMTDYHKSGQSVMEMSHRSDLFEAILRECEDLLRGIMGIPAHYKVLFLQGGASSQFSMVPLNLLTPGGTADYIISGLWADRAYKEACRYGRVRAVASSEDGMFSYIPSLDPAAFDKDADYFHLCLNNTVYGTRFSSLPDTGSVPLVADVSSCILSEPIDVSKFSLLYAGAQKNMASAGLTVVIVREDLLGRARDITPTMSNYQIHAENGSMYNTPPTYAIYIAKLVLEWLKNEIGGLENMQRINRKKAALLYDCLDQSKLFYGTAKKEDRSLMNIPFTTDSEEMNGVFIREAERVGLINLRGYRSVGGMRASLYNALPLEGVERLVSFMKRFEADHASFSKQYPSL